MRKKKFLQVCTAVLGNVYDNYDAQRNLLLDFAKQRKPERRARVWVGQNPNQPKPERWMFIWVGLLDLANQPIPEQCVLVWIGIHSPTDSEPNGIPFGSKSVGK